VSNDPSAAPLRITHISDPGCPFAYSAMPFITALHWRYGDQIAWRHVMIGLTEDRTQYEDRGYTPLLMARSQRRFRRFGMPFAREPKPRMAATARACRLVVATRLTRPELEWPMFRALQFTQFTTTHPLDADEALRDALAQVPELDAEQLMGMLDTPAVTEAYEADRAEARTAEGGATEFQGKAANTDGKVRFTAPSLLIEAADGRRLEVGGFQPLEAYDVAIANLDRSLTRRGPATDVRQVVEAFPYALATREIATVLSNGLDPADDAVAEDELLELVAAGDVQSTMLGDGTLWRAASARVTRGVATAVATTA
jgi:protein-disulfide isomerase-like protein with CxxC motif